MILTFTVLVSGIGVAYYRRQRLRLCSKVVSFLTSNGDSSARRRGTAVLDVRVAKCDHASPTKPRPLLDLRVCDRLGSTSSIKFITGYNHYQLSGVRM